MFAQLLEPRVETNRDPENKIHGTMSCERNEEARAKTEESRGEAPETGGCEEGDGDGDGGVYPTPNTHKKNNTLHGPTVMGARGPPARWTTRSPPQPDPPILVYFVKTA